MSKHTPGPWVAMKDGKYVTENPYNVDHEDEHDLTTAPVGGPDGQVVALVVMDDEFRKNRWDDTELDANARLIAAAPELLVELKRIVDNAEQAAEEGWIERVRPHGDCTQVRWQFEESSDYQDFLEDWNTQIAAIAKAIGQ